jgi:hypothetical protein
MSQPVQVASVLLTYHLALAQNPSCVRKPYNPLRFNQASRSGKNLSRRQYRPGMTHIRARGLLLLDYSNGTLGHPLDRIRPAGAAPAVGVQLNLRYATNTEPFILHLLPRQHLTVE